MHLAQKLAGYTMAEADSLRKAMGKKDREEMALQEQKFVDGAVSREIRKDKAQQVFSLMRQFADYGFPKSHAVAYAYLAFQTAYLKAHFPEHFYAAVLSNEIEDSAKVFRYTKEMRGQGIELLPPDVNESEIGFTPLVGAIRYGLAAIKGIGFASVNAIIKARTSGRFRSLSDFTERIEEGSVNKRVLEGLVYSGAFDSLKEGSQTLPSWRARVFAGIDSALARSARSRRAKALGQDDLFGSDSDLTLERLSPLPEAIAWTPSEMLAAEKKALGFYITGHPLDAHAESVSQLGAVASGELASLETGSRATIAGVVTDLQLRTTKKGDRFAIFRLEDHLGSVKCVLWPEPYSRYSVVVQDQAPVLVTGRAEIDENSATIFAEKVLDLNGAVQRKARELVIRLPKGADAAGLCDRIIGLLEQSKGECDFLVELPIEGSVVHLRAHHSLKVQGSGEIEAALREFGCEVRWTGHASAKRSAAAGSKP
ncbi:MAG: hypothetical protein DMF70_09335 [Acidobacteria bacterium]|nr:MAG: hypothetical protein DMF70_09335 [Acidobacteriota bacterium]